MDPSRARGPRTHDSRPYDPGRQPERTALAWRRTALSLLVVSLGAARLLTARWGAGGAATGVTLGAAGAACGALVHVLAGRRARRGTARLLGHDDLRNSGAGLLAVTAAGTSLLGLGALTLVVLGHSPGGA